MQEINTYDKCEGGKKKREIFQRNIMCGAKNMNGELEICKLNKKFKQIIIWNKKFLTLGEHFEDLSTILS